MLAWVFRRCEGTADAEETAIGLVPTMDALPTDGLDIKEEDMHELLRVDAADWAGEIEPIREFYATFGDKLPDELTGQLDRLAERVGDADR